MTAIPSSTPPARVIPAILKHATGKSGIALLACALRAISRQALDGVQAPLEGLQTVLQISTSTPEALTSEILLSSIIAYPLHRKAINELVGRVLTPNILEEFRGEILPSLVTRLQLCHGQDLCKVIRIILLIIRSHDDLLGLALEEATYVIPALRTAYQSLDGLEGQSDTLILCHELVSAVQGESKDALKRLMGGGHSKQLLLGQTLREDYEALFERAAPLPDGLVSRLDAMRDARAAEDPRVKVVKNLFPHVPANTILAALHHSFFAVSTIDPEASAAPLIDAMLSGSSAIPEDLLDLRTAVEHVQMSTVDTAPPSTRSAYERRNIWDDQKMDMSRLKLADDGDIPELGQTIPDHLRDSIMRLVESQVEEEAEREAALREAHGAASREMSDDEESQVSRMKIAGDGEESGEEEEGDKVVPRKESSGKTYDVDQQSKLELAYLANPAVFDRDSNTRRSGARKKLKELTGMDDAQLEGWRVMLDRNPHKEAILNRHTFSPTKDHLGSVETKARPDGPSYSNRGRGGGHRGGRGGGRGDGHGGSEQGNSNGGTRGSGGRGRTNKSSRGHSNAARTRGHDKKMSRMGAGL
ncbi:hypothetical protein BD324DRAFT_528654 [Kockovaella imperatae]|uniref:CUE domain-containing protein n=1 Tax=Kockovaella imperatae TaxID=4999 RepID=A0A1Y1UDR0_9TREE|nr:hypothetical protein BD324DRAFT_528654 [Kockovaella imperatae]ORX36173.1 hypothetical protein BD324DRAFT_528654 [Kockovaella imperatae]